MVHYSASKSKYILMQIWFMCACMQRNLCISIAASDLNQRVFAFVYVILIFNFTYIWFIYICIYVQMHVDVLIYVYTNFTLALSFVYLEKKFNLIDKLLIERTFAKKN